MLEIRKISKIYETEDLKQTALNKVSINFRNNEFASILGPSGSGKTTLLNIIGGLDHYDSGDLIINEISTKKYSDRDWDSYRNHRIGFVFQSYNLITHQTILQNVELALTLSGVSKHERTKRAKKALKDVGLERHMNKKPNQLSGGQMQRVAIARALVNNPDIVLADEPTGALDSVTSEQIMELLKEVAKDKLVIMVTHNPELAEKYSTRIIKLKDGEIIDDSNPYDGKQNTKDDLEKELKKSKKTSMNLLTALSLSLNNLMTKKGRTFLTAFAGSIGIIGIALISSLSTGVQEYIDRTGRDALSSYPISIEKTTTDITSLMQNHINNNSVVVCKDDKICTTDDITNDLFLSGLMATKENNLTKFKNYLDSNGGNINNYVTAIGYAYDLDLQIYSSKFENGIVKVNPNTFSMGGDSYNNPFINSYFSPNVFKELIDSKELLKSQYDILSGKLPENYNELVLIVDKDYQMPASLMYSLNIEDRKEVADIIKKMKSGEDVKLDSVNYNYDDLINYSFKLILNTDYYKKENGKWKNMSDDEEYMKELINKGVELKIVGVLKVNDNNEDINGGYIGYTNGLTQYVINEINKTEIATQQRNNKNINILNEKPLDDIDNTYEAVCHELGIIDIDNPMSINIYPKDFNSKEKIENILQNYNDEQELEENMITYTDMIGILLSSVTSIVDVISYILIAFVAVSLVVSSIMIAIITYISVLERTKEIGILRAIGASKKDISRVFNAETIIEGFVAGLLGVIIAYLITIPVNIIVKSLTDVSGIAHLSLFTAIILIIISIFLTVIAGLIPSRIASKKDPVESLRSE